MDSKGFIICGLLSNEGTCTSSRFGALTSTTENPPVSSLIPSITFSTFFLGVQPSITRTRSLLPNRTFAFALLSSICTSSCITSRCLSFSLLISSISRSLSLISPFSLFIPADAPAIASFVLFGTCSGGCQNSKFNRLNALPTSSLSFFKVTISAKAKDSSPSPSTIFFDTTK